MDDVWPSFVEYPAKKVEVQVADEPGDQRASGFTRFSALLFPSSEWGNIAIGWLGRGENDRTNGHPLAFQAVHYV